MSRCVTLSKYRRLSVSLHHLASVEMKMMAKMKKVCIPMKEIPV
jgi:hypothetical protein